MLEKSIDSYKIIIMDKDGNIFPYSWVFGVQHQDCINDFAKKNGYDSDHPEALAREGLCLLYNLKNKEHFFIMPNELSDMQMYNLEYIIDKYKGEKRINIETLDGRSFILTDEIVKNFSSEVLQTYYSNSNKKRQ